MRDLKGYTRTNQNGWLSDILLLAFIFAIPFFLFLGKSALIDPDEGRYAEIPREMLERLDFITPTLNYVQYFEKPPLLYWLNAASLKLFGLSEMAARLPSACCGLLTVLFTYFIARKMYGRRTALIATFILGTSTGFLLQSRIILTDMLLTCCLTAALGLFIVSANRAGYRKKPFGWYLFYFFCALAVLTKGLIGALFPAGIIFFYMLLGRRWKLLREMYLLRGILLFLAITVPWFVMVSQKNPEFASFFFIHEHYERFTTTLHGRSQPFWFFIPVLLATMFPWSFFILGSIRRTWRDRHHDDGRGGLFLLIWALLIFLFFSKSGSKLIPYMLPIFPPLAIMIAARLEKLLDGRGREIKVASLMLGTTMTLAGVAALFYARLPQISPLITEQIPQLALPLQSFIKNAPEISNTASTVIASLFLLQGFTALITAGRNPRLLLVILCLFSFLLETVVPTLVILPISADESPRELAIKAAPLITADTAIISSGPMQAVSWYLKRRVMVTGKLDELEFGSKQGDQSAWFPAKQEVLRIWESERKVLFFLKKRELNDLKEQLKPEAVIVGESRRWLLITNRPVK